MVKSRDLIKAMQTVAGDDQKRAQTANWFSWTKLLKNSLLVDARGSVNGFDSQMTNNAQ